MLDGNYDIEQQKPGKGIERVTVEEWISILRGQGRPY